MAMKEYAIGELLRAGLLKTSSDYDGSIGESVIELITIYSEQGHSGGSSDMTLAVFNRLVNRMPLTPLTGEDDEWIDRSEYQSNNTKLYQNVRCPSVFKDEHRTWDIYNTDENDNPVDISFPYMPDHDRDK